MDEKEDKKCWDTNVRIMFHEAMIAQKRGHCAIIPHVEDGSLPVNARHYLFPPAKINQTILYAVCGYKRASWLCVIRALIKAGADVYAESYGKDGKTTLGTPLIQACRIGSVEMVNELVKAGANVHYSVIARGQHLSALFLACEKGYADIDNTLLNAGADANLQREVAKGKTMSVLHVACKEGELGILSALISAGADVNVRSYVRSFNIKPETPQ
jgi:hypothetical protein